ncbi:MAG: SHOCT domain-containing protein [Paracoccaceae bacterium]
MTRFAIALAATPLSAAPSLADPAGPGGYHDHMWGGYGMGYGFFGLGLTILFWAVLIALAVFAFRWLSQSGTLPPKSKGDDALEILKQRLAKGEIDPEEYAVRKKALEE